MPGNNGSLAAWLEAKLHPSACGQASPHILSSAPAARLASCNTNTHSCSAETVYARLRVGRQASLEDLRNAEVAHFDDVAAADEDIGWLDVPMQDGLAVQVLEALQRCGAVRDCGWQGLRSIEA